MCGIAGFIRLKHDHSTIMRMLESMKHRGPDERGTFIDGDVCLLHQRLTIIDPEKGKQPINLNWNYEEYTMIYNGELYNTEDIRKELVRLEHTFLGHSDTEVLIHAYAQWGARCLEKLNGIYAFAVWEHDAKRLFVARDRMGVKPLFYALHDNGIIFASEIKTILAHGAISPVIDKEGVGELLLLGPGRTPGRGVFKNILELMPGCCGYYAENRFVWHHYWELKDREHTETFQQTADHVRYLVTDAIERQMVSDVPIGTFLSGGLDSSLITSVCTEKMKEKGSALPTFSVGYDKNDIYFVPGKFQPNSDERYIDIMSGYLQTMHKGVMLRADALYEGLFPAVLARDLPGMADVDSSLLLFCRSIREDVKVALSGECADEIFGGYPWYRDPEVQAAAGFPWSQNTLKRQSLMRDGIFSKDEALSFVRSRYMDTVSACDILPGASPENRRVKELVNLNIRWFMQTLLDRKDRMSMACSLEVRVPFCDHRIAEYMYGVPWSFKEYQGREKGLLRYAMKDYLPYDVLYRKKSPYPKTYDPVYMTTVANHLTALIKDKSQPIHELISAKAMEQLLISDDPWPWYGQLMKTPQTIAYLLQFNSWLQQYHVDIAV